MRTILLTCCMVALAGFSAHAATIDDVIEMAKKGESEEKQIIAVDKTPGDITIGAAEVLRLRDAKISEKVILAMLRHVATDKPATANAAPPALAAPAPNPAIAPIAPVERAAVPPENPVALPPVNKPPAPVAQNGLQSGSLTIDNLDDRPWSYMYEPAVQTIWIAPPEQGSVIQAHSATTVSMRVGTYKVRFTGSHDEGLPITVFGGERSAISLSRVTAEGGESLNASIFEHGERKTSGKLVIFNGLPPQEVVVERQIIETPVYYYGGYYGGGYYPYYGGRYYSRPIYGYGYYGGGSGHYGGGSGSHYGGGGHHH